MPAVLQLAALSGAFWLMVLKARGCAQSRVVVALLAGGGASHLAWVALNWRHLEAGLAWLVVPAGFTVLAFPLGPLLFARAPEVWRHLPGALVCARAGCEIARCCGGIEAPWGRHPVGLYEIGILLAVYRLQRMIPDPFVEGVFLAGFGLARLLVEPWREPNPLGETLVPVEAIALAWISVGAIQLERALRRG